MQKLASRLCPGQAIPQHDGGDLEVTTTIGDLRMPRSGDVHVATGFAAEESGDLINPFAQWWRPGGHHYDENFSPCRPTYHHTTAQISTTSPYAAPAMAPIL